LVKIGTTGVQKHLFFNLRRLKARLNEFESGALSPETAVIISKELNVTVADVMEMNGRISGPDDSLNATIGSEGSDQWLELLSDEQPSPEHLLADCEEQRRRLELVNAALVKLGDREREILVARYLQDEQATFEQLSQRYAVSRERVRQIEQRAIEKIRRSTLASQVTARPAPEIIVAA
jgi:RNA polymerase sigma-32 factor